MKRYRDVTYLMCLVALTLPLRALAADEKPLPPPALPKPWYKVSSQTIRAAISPNAKLIATLLERSSEIVLYDRVTGKELRRFGAKEKSGTRLFSFTPDGKRLLTHHGILRENGGRPERYEVLVWEVATGKLLRRFGLLKYQGARITSGGRMLYGVSDKVLVAAGLKEVGTVYDLETGKALGTFPGDHRPTMLALSRNGKWLVTAGRDDKLCVWDVEKRMLVHTLYEHTKRVDLVAISADGAWCASSTSDKRLWVFDRTKGIERARTNTLFVTNKDGDLVFSPDGKTLVGTGEGAHFGLMVWDWQRSREIRGGYPREGRSVLMDGNEKKWNVSETSDASIASDGTLMAFTGIELHLWDFIAAKPSPSPEPGAAPSADK